MVIKQQLYEIVWSPRALKSYEAILDYILEQFNEVAVKKFVRKTLNFLTHVARDPEMFRKSEKGKNKHLVVITKKTTLYYRIKPRKKEAELLVFWNTKRNPAKLKY